MACIYNERFKMKLLVSQDYESPIKTPIRIFLDEFSEHITTLLQQNDDPIILGDINIPWNKENKDRESLLEIMDLYNLKQHVLTQTHKQGNTLDWIIF